MDFESYSVEDKIQWSAMCGVDWCAYLCNVLRHYLCVSTGTDNRPCQGGKQAPSTLTDHLDGPVVYGSM